MISLPVIAENYCDVNYIDFISDVELCNPELSNDLNGWFNDSIRNGACDGKFNTSIDSVKQTGLVRAKVKTFGEVDFNTWAESQTVSSNKGSYVGVVSNPRVLSPYFIEPEFGHMLVVAGVSSNTPFMTYKVTDLVPGSDVDVTVEAYSLLSAKQMEEYLFLLNDGREDGYLIRELDFAGHTFAMQSTGSKLTAGSGKINGNKAGFTVSTGFRNGMASGDFKECEFFGEEKNNYGVVNLTTKADENGEITLYFVTKAGSQSSPIGIEAMWVTGQLQPKITSSKRMPACPSSPVTFKVENALDDVEYSWKTSSESSDESSFTTSFDDVNKVYNVSCTITKNECEGSNKFVVETKECCTDENHNPLEQYDIFYDDFGEFSSNKTEYTYTDVDGTKKTVPVTGGIFTDINRPYSTVIQEGASSDFPAASSASGHTVENSWMITNINPYVPGVSADADGNPNGGMMIIDMSGSDIDGKPIKDMVIYRHTATGEYKGKNVTFGCSIGAINSLEDEGTLKAIVKDGDSIVVSQELKVNGTAGWIQIEQSFIANSDELTVEISNVTANYVAFEGDIAIDNVYMTYCYKPEKTAISNVAVADNAIIKTEYFNIAGQQVDSNAKGVILVRQYLENGEVLNHKVVKE